MPAGVDAVNQTPRTFLNVDRIRLIRLKDDYQRCLDGPLRGDRPCPPGDLSVVILNEIQMALAAKGEGVGA